MGHIDVRVTKRIFSRVGGAPGEVLAQLEAGVSKMGMPVSALEGKLTLGGGPAGTFTNGVEAADRSPSFWAMAAGRVCAG